MRGRYVLLTTLVFLLVGVGGGLGLARAQVPDERTGVRVSGQGQVTAQPDVAIFNLSASVVRDRPDAAFDRTEQLITAATAVMREQGVAERDIITSGLSLFQEYRFPTPEQPEPVLLGWRARHSLTVRVRDFARLGRVVAGGVAALEEAGEVQGIGFTVENNQALINQARDAALADARTKAERIAAGLGLRLGAVTFVQESSAPFPTLVRTATPVPAPIAQRPPGAPPVPAQITAGEQTFSVTVEVHYAIEGAPPR